MKLTSAILLAMIMSIVSPSSLYLYVGEKDHRCFYEELQGGLAVMGQFSTEALDEKTKLFKEDPALKVHITVDVEQTHAREVEKTAGSKGVFNFVASEYGTHVVCVSVTGAKQGARLHMAFFYGDEVQEDHVGNEHWDLNHKVKNLKFRTEGLLREVDYAREREKEFRDLSEDVNHKVMWWTLYQFIILGIDIIYLYKLGGAVVWQLRHLKSFFVSKKLV
jgi:hypothetical protein